MRRTALAGLAALALGGCGGGDGGSSDAITGTKKDQLSVYLKSIPAQCALRAAAAERHDIDAYQHGRTGQPPYQLKTPLPPGFTGPVNYLIAQLDQHADDTLDLGPGNTHPLKDFVLAEGRLVATKPPVKRNCGGGPAVAVGQRMIDAAEAKGAKAPLASAGGLAPRPRVRLG